MYKLQVGCVDVSTGGLAVSCDTDGKLKVWTTDTGEIRVSSRASLALLFAH